MIHGQDAWGLENRDALFNPDKVTEEAQVK